MRVEEKPLSKTAARADTFPVMRRTIQALAAAGRGFEPRRGRLRRHRPAGRRRARVGVARAGGRARVRDHHDRRVLRAVEACTEPPRAVPRRAGRSVAADGLARRQGPHVEGRRRARARPGGGARRHRRPEGDRAHEARRRVQAHRPARESRTRRSHTCPSTAGWPSPSTRPTSTPTRPLSRRGSLASDERLEAGFAALPPEALARAWVDVAALAPQLLPQTGTQGSSSVDLGLDWLSTAVAAEADGVKVVVGVRTPGGNGTDYAPELFGHVPADAVAALSFGGTQKLVDQLERRIPLGDIAKQVREGDGRLGRRPARCVLRGGRPLRPSRRAPRPR